MWFADMLPIDKLRAIRAQMLSGFLTYDEAKREAAPVIAEMNKRSKEIAAQHGVRFKPVSFAAVMR